MKNEKQMPVDSDLRDIREIDNRSDCEPEWREKLWHLKEIKNANAAPAHCPLDMKSQFASLCPATKCNFVRYYSHALDNWVLHLCTENEDKVARARNVENY